MSSGATLRAPVTDETPSTPPPCSPCRGSGRLISKLGGEPHEVECAWCEGTGIFIPEHDAQAARRGDASAGAS
jgi:DnaJ-class molecular chaperone